MLTMSVDTREFNQAMDELRKVAHIEDGKVIRDTTKFLVRTFVAKTKLFRRVKNEDYKWLEPYIAHTAKGRARLGWWPAWRRLGASGVPSIGNGPLKDNQEGGITDASRRIRNPHITIWNEVPYIEALNKGGRILENGVKRQIKFMEKAIDRAYTKTLRKKSGI